MKNDKILPCPFCGETPIEITIDGLYAVKCNNPDCWICPQTSLYTEKETANVAWTERAEPENKPLTLEQLRERVGNPVWIEDLVIKSCSAWHFVLRQDGEIRLFDIVALARKVVGYSATSGRGYGECWVAYDHPPKEAAPHE